MANNSFSAMVRLARSTNAWALWLLASDLCILTDVTSKYFCNITHELCTRVNYHCFRPSQDVLNISFQKLLIPLLST